MLRDYCALFTHFTECSSTDNSRSSKERSKYSGLAKKLQSWFFVSETCMLKDALRCIKHLSLYLQSTSASVVDVGCHVTNIKLKLLALKQDNGKSMTKFFSSYQSDQQHKGVDIVKKDTDDAQFTALRCQFFFSHW